MKRNSRWRYWFSIGFFSFSIGISRAEAQISPDTTLPTVSQVVPGCTVCTITGGTVRGVNLYHSFSSFSIPIGGEAYFNNGLQIQNILTRVTGNTGSTIDGLIRSNGSANLFFLNPNGIVFGPNAELRLGGSFFATTSRGFNFADGSQFNAIDPQAPPLLTVSVAPGLQTGFKTFQTIETQGTLQVPQDLQLDGFLRLQGNLIAGRNLTLKGNNIGGPLRILAGGSVTVTENMDIQGNGATQPTVEIRAGTDPNQASTLTIGRTNAGGDYLSGRITNRDGLVYLSNSSTLGGDINFGQIDTTGFGTIRRGSVTIEARGNIASSGFLRTNFGFTNGGALQSETVTLLAGKSVIFNRPDRLTSEFGGSSLLSQSILSNQFIEVGTINVIAGNEIRMNGPITVDGDLIKLQAKSIELADGAKLIADTAGPKNAGDILIKADSVKFSGTGPVASLQALNSTNSQDLIASGAFSQVLNGDTGNGGKIDIQTRLLTVSKGAQISAVTNGQGHAGSIDLNVTEQAEFDGVGSNKGNILQNNNSGGPSLSETFELFAPSGAFSSVRKDAIVRPEVRDITGNVTITTPSLRVINGARLTSSLSGTGNAGDVKINANDILLSNAGSNATIPGAVDDFSGGISVLNQGVGTGGNITINTDRLNVEKGIVIAALTRGNGNAGTVAINAKESVAIDRSFLISDVQAGGTGIAGDITINAPSLRVTNGARLTSSLSGTGAAGGVKINANDILLSNAGPNATIPGAVNDLSGGISVLNQGVGTGGNITINTDRLNVEKGIVIAALTRGNGNAGTVAIDAKESVAIDRSFLISDVQAGGTGIAGDITINAPSLRVTNGARLTSSLSGTGAAGGVKINANDILLSNAGPNATIPGAVNDLSGGISVLNQGVGTGGNISINTDRLNVEKGIVIAALTRGNGNAGTVAIDAKESVAIDRSFLISDVQAGGTGIAGDIKITTGSLALTNTARISVDSKGTGEGGAITLATNQLNLDNNSSITAETTSGRGGNITIDAKDLVFLRRQSLLSTTAGTQNAGGNGGNITINSPFVVAVLRENSDIRANAFTGKGGNINITANQVFGLRQQLQDTPFSDITASSALGINGTININNLSLDPSQGLQALNLTPVDSSKLIAQGCNSGRRVVEGQSRFVVLGRGGFSSSPDDPFSGMGVLNDLGNLVPSSRRAVPSVTQQIPPPRVEIVEAQGFAKDSQGNVYLVSQSIGSPTIDPSPSPVQCQGK